MAGPRDPTPQPPEQAISRAFKELLEMTWAEHQALAAQLDRILAMERQLLDLGRVLGQQVVDRAHAVQAPGLPDPGPPGRPPKEARAQASEGSGGPEEDLQGPPPPDELTLTDVPGVGKIRAKALEEAGYDVPRLAEATVEELAQVHGLGPKVARRIKTAVDGLLGRRR